MSRMNARHCAALLQGVFYVSTGVWPLVHLPSFLAVTGPKHDLWLVQTFGALLTAVGCVLVAWGLRRQNDETAPQIALVVAIVLAWADIYYFIQGALSAVY